MGRTLQVKMAKASPEDLQKLRDFFGIIEEVMEYGTYTESHDGESKPVDEVELYSMIREMWGIRGPGVGSSWGRVVHGCEILIDNCCDSGSSTLEWKPEIQKAMELAEQNKE